MSRRLVPALLVSLAIIACGLDQEGSREPEANAGSGGSAASSGSGAQGGTAGSSGSSGTGGTGGSSAAAGAGGVSGSAGEASGGSAGSAGGGGSAGEAGSASGGSSGTVSQTIDIFASVADCAATSQSDPDVCLQQYPGELHVDVSAVYLSDLPSAAYLRFDVGGEIAGASVTSAELVLQNVNGSDMSGVVHQVTPFTRADLFGTAPAPGAVVSSDRGPVSPGSVVWPLTVVPEAATPYCVMIRTATNDGIGYERLGGANPPKLRVTFSK